MMHLTLHAYWRSSASFRVRIALALKGLDYAYVGHDLRTLLRLVDGRSPHPSGLEISERSGGLFKVLFPQPLGVRCAASAAGCWPTRWGPAPGSVQLNIHFLRKS